jgi:hypothetical protein
VVCCTFLVVEERQLAAPAVHAILQAEHALTYTLYTVSKAAVPLPLLLTLLHVLLLCCFAAWLPLRCAVPDLHRHRNLHVA